MKFTSTRSASSCAGVAAAISLAAMLAAAGPAAADEAQDIAAIRAEMEAMRADYDARMNALEARLEKAEEAASAAEVKAANAGAAPAPVVAAAPPPQPASPRPPVSASAYNPGIAVVLNGTYAAFENDPEAAMIPGFQLGEEAGLDSRGFSLGESEIALNANIDHRLYGNLIFALTDGGEVEVEEAYIQTTSLPGGFTLRGGKFYSGIGYLNEKHNHAWEFIDAPLPYRVFLGGQLGDAGVEARWIAPTDFFLEAGGEVLRGDSLPAGGAANKGAGAYAAFVQTGGDIGFSSSWLAKLSYLHSEADELDIDGDIFTGDDETAIASLVYKWAPDGNPTVRNLILNGEFFFNNHSGEFNGTPIDLDRTGWYAQGVYQFRKNWRFGVRYARLASDGVPAALIGSVLDDRGRSPDAISTMLEFDTSEFSRFRLMYTYDDTDLASNNELLLRYTVTYGPHGAHRF